MIKTSSLVERIGEKVDEYTAKHGHPPKGICVGPYIYLMLLLHDEINNPTGLLPVEVDFDGIPIVFDSIGGDCRLYS